MKKRIIAVFAIVVLALTLGGCTGGGTKISSAAIANPWSDVKTLEEAETAMGFEMELPDDFKDAEVQYRVCQGLNMIEVDYSGEAYIRKAKDDGDVSGDYNEYAKTIEVTVDNISYTFKGDDADALTLAVWNVGDYSYAIGLEKGVSGEDFTKLAAEVK